MEEPLSRVLVVTWLLAHAATGVGYILRLECKTEADFVTFHPGRRIRSKLIATEREVGDVQCMVKCVEHRKCRSYNVNAKEMLCELSGSAHADKNTELEVATGWIYKSTDFNTRLVGETCKRLRPCNDGAMCEDSCTPPYYKCIPCSNDDAEVPCGITIECRSEKRSHGEMKIRGTRFCVENVAEGKKTTQSTTDHRGVSERAVDGLRHSNYHAESCTHTDKENQPWWQVDLGQKYLVLGANITNRSDCCEDRLSNFKLTVDSLPCFHVDTLTAITSTHLCTSTAWGQIVKIQLMERNTLSLCEVEVIGAVF